MVLSQKDEIYAKCIFLLKTIIPVIEQNTKFKKIISLETMWPITF